MELYHLIALAHTLNGTLGSAKCQHVSCDEVWRRIEDGTIFALLRERLNDPMAVKFMGPVSRTELQMEWDSFRSKSSPSDGSGSRHGISLLLDYVLQGILYRAQSPLYRLVPKGYDPMFQYDDDEIMAM